MKGSKGDKPADDADEPIDDDAGEPGDDDSSGDDAHEPDLEQPEAGDDDGCEKVKSPGSGKKVCASHGRRGGDVEQACPATNRDCDDPVTDEPEADEPADDAAPDEE